MVRGLYTAASGALVAQSQVDVIANNLANVNTVGFKRSLLQVVDNRHIDLYRYQTDPTKPTAAGNNTQGVANAAFVGTLGLGSLIYDTPTILDQGALQPTDNPLDFGLHGPGYFVVQEPNGAIRYTRNGAFLRNNQGQLTTDNGDLVLDQNNAPITLPDSRLGQPQINGQGQIYVNNQLVGQFKLVEFLDPQNSRPEGANRDGAATVSATSNTDVVQFHLERSNAEVVKSMTDLISAERWFDANIKVIQTEDQLTGDAVTTVGRTNA